MKKYLSKIFGGINLTWPKLIIFSIIIGIWTALVAMLAPDGNSFHDIAVTAEWWVLPAILIIVNSKKPLEAALKVFVFFLISQPLVYLIQVPFSAMGWSLFGYYGYWFKITLLTFPAAFVAWFVKKDKWYSGIILAGATTLLVISGFSFARNLPDDFPNHLLTIIYCFGIIPIFILYIFKNLKPRIITAAISLIALIACICIVGFSQPYEAYNNTVLADEGIELVGDAEITFFSGTKQGDVKLIKNENNYTIKLSGETGGKYNFDIGDESGATYSFESYFDKDQNTVVVKRK